MARKNQLLNQRLNRDNGRNANETYIAKKDVPETQIQNGTDNKKDKLAKNRFKRQSEENPKVVEEKKKSPLKTPYYNRKKLVSNQRQKAKKESGLLERIPMSQDISGVENIHEQDTSNNAQMQNMSEKHAETKLRKKSEIQVEQRKKKKKEKTVKVPKEKKNEGLSRLSGHDMNTTEKEEEIKKMYENPSLTQMDKMPESLNAEEYELNLEKASLEQSQKKIKREKRVAVASQIGKMFMMALSFYLVFLIYGVFMTNYEYDDTGKIVPCTMTVEEIREQKEYDLILSCYEDARDIYGEIFMLDYRVSLSEEDYRIIATEYELLTERLTPLINKMNAMEFSSKYTVVYNMLLNWVSDYAAGYVQNMAIALSTDNQKAASDALAYREYAIANFTAIQENMVSIGNTITGVYTEEMAEWSPEAYIREQIYGKE